MRRLVMIVALCLFPLPLWGQSLEYTSSGWLGGSEEDVLHGARIQSSGTLVVAGTLSALPDGVVPTRLAGANDASQGVVMRLSPDAKQVLSVTQVADEVLDLALNAKGQIVIAAGAKGVMVLDAGAKSLVWSKALDEFVHRVDVGQEGNVAALTTKNPDSANEKASEGRVHLFSGDGGALADFKGWRNTQDLCVDAASKTTVLVGWRQANAFDGRSVKPVQIAYLRGVGFDGQTKWTRYDWSTDRDSPRFLNTPENNMADTRGYRCTVGPDNKLYAAFEAAGGNHIFRYSPASLKEKVKIVGGDRYHTFSNSKSEHKLFFAKYDPSNGDYIQGQQFTGRLSSGAANTVRVRGGDIRVDQEGRVLLTGESASGLPIDDAAMLPGTGDYKGGAYLLFMSADFTKRLWINRVSPKANGRAVDIRTFEPGKPNIVQVGATRSDNDMYQLNPIQKSYGGGKSDGFVAMLGGVIPKGWTPDATPSPDMGTGGEKDMAIAGVEDMSPGSEEMGAVMLPDMATSASPDLSGPSDMGLSDQPDAQGGGSGTSSSGSDEGCSSSGTGAPTGALGWLLGLVGLLGLKRRQKRGQFFG